MSFQPTLRRNQLIAPFGVGALHVLKGSRTVVTAGLDFWFDGATLQQLASVRVREPRLEARLQISHLRLPPGPETDLKGSFRKLEIPLFRFPTWYVCPRCNGMGRRPLGMDGDANCANAECRGEVMRQISFAAVCDYGHLQDFPWKEWVRREKNPTCAGQNCQLYYKAGGSGSLADISIECKTCIMKRNLAGIMSGEMPDRESANPREQRGSSTLSSILLAQTDGEDRAEACPEFLCQGGCVWHGVPGGPPGASCLRPLRAVLISATNVHYAQIDSALWIPPAKSSTSIEDLKILLDRPEVRNLVKALKSFNFALEQIAQHVLSSHTKIFNGRTKEEVLKALDEGHLENDLSWQEGLDLEEILRFPEYQQLQNARKPLTTGEPLEIRRVDRTKLPDRLLKIISGISLVDKLRETRAFRGFNRLVPQPDVEAPPPQSHLWRKPPTDHGDKWLPCSVVYGEGIFIRFDEDCIAAWEAKNDLSTNLHTLQHRENAAAGRMGRLARQISPRYLLLHTFAHLLIRRLVFECGYGSASLRERLYISEKRNAPMTGILIYTASGDCEGSMGGLVRMGEPENFARIFDAAVQDAIWCSADPICTESGLNGGQGIDGLNIAACHCCTLLPETACECFNCYLDRGAIANFISFTKMN
jgi:hypothetical protein